MLSRFTLTQKALFWLSIVLCAQFVFVAALVYLYTRTDIQAKACLHDQLVIGHLNKVSNLWSKLGVELPRSLALTDERSPLSDVISQIHSEFNELSTLALHQTDEMSKINRLLAVTNLAIEAMARAKDAWYEGDIKRFVRVQDEIARLSDDATMKSNLLLDRLRESHDEHQLEKNRLSNDLNALLFDGLCANIGIALITAYIFVAIIVGKTERLSHNMVRLSHGVPLNEPLSGDDEIARLDRTFHQMADRLAEAARKERALIDNASDVICTLDADGTFLGVNPAARLMLGCDPDALEGKPFFDFLAPEERNRVTVLMRSLPSSAKRSVRIQTRLAEQNGSSTPVLLAANWSAADRSLYCILHDISERWQVQQMKRQFVAMITHDLRSPLNSIMNTFDAIEEGIYAPSSEKGTLRVRESVQNIDRMLQLLSDLLSLVNVDATSMSVDLTSVSLKEIVQESVASVCAYAEQTGVVIETELADVCVLADRFRMTQVVVNLLSNAIKFSLNSSVVKVRAISGANSARVEVEDSGPGISAADQSLIFEPYRQAQSGPKSLHLKGTGLGLTVCKTIVEAHGGQIGVVSEEAVGSTFWLEIPRV